MDVASFLPGFCQGICRVLVSYPFDYYRSFLQTSTPINISTLHSLRRHSFLYKGVLVPLTTIPLDRAVQFYTFEKLKAAAVNPYISGCIGGIVSCCLSLPSTYIVNHHVLKDTPLTALLHPRNMSHFRLGALVEAARSVLASTCYLGTYSQCRDRWGNQSVSQNAHNAVCASTVTWLATYPLETVKIHRQLGASYTDLWTRLRGNWPQLYRGLPIVLARSIPSSIVGMSVYEHVRSRLESAASPRE